jgi:phosphate-selective porin
VASPDEPLDTDTEPAQLVPPPSAPRFVWKQHPSLRFGKALRIDFQAKFQDDARSSYPDAETRAGLATWELHRSRIGVQGTLFRHIDFEVERELREKELSERDVLLGLTPDPAWKDVNVNVDYIDNLQIQVGKFKVPFGLDTLTGVSQNDFIYRALGSSYLTPSRDIGVMAHGRFFKRGLSYWTGVFRHDGDNARSKKIQGGDATFAARVTALPLRHAAPDRFGAFEVGSSFAVTRVSDDSFRPNGLRGRTVVTQDTFFESVYAKGRRLRWAADLDWTLGPGSLRTEYIQVAEQRLGQGFGDEALPDARYRSFYVSGTWLLTGDAKSRPVKPANDFLRGGIGAIEAAARFDRIWFDSVDKSDDPFANPRAFTILPTGDKVFTAGVNWSLNRFVKLQVNAIREQVEDPGRNPVANGAAFWSRVFRLQLVL